MSRDAREIEIRLVRPHEDSELREVRLSALGYSSHLADHLAKETVAPPSFWRDRAERAAVATTMATFVAVDGRAFVGIVDGFLAEQPETVEVGGMWVKPDRRRSGLGSQLLVAILGWARDRGASRAGLWVREVNEPARLLYESHGFKPSKTTNVGLRLEKTL